MYQRLTTTAANRNIVCPLCGLNDAPDILCQELNASRESEETPGRKILVELFESGGDTVLTQPPFDCDYGTNTLLGERVFFNFNCVVTKNLPDDVFAAGNPCRVMRAITE